MERLAKLCKPSRYLTFSQLIILKNTCNNNGIKVIFIHKFLVKFIMNGEKAFLKINPYDGEFFFISKEHQLITFSSFRSFSNWFENNFILRGDKNG